MGGAEWTSLDSAADWTERRPSTVLWTGTTRRALWIAALVVYGVGDVATSVVGFALGAAEQHLVVSLLVAGLGLPETVVVLSCWKGVALVGFYLLSIRVGRFGPTVPLGLALFGSVVVGWNSVVVTALLLS